MSSGGNIKLTEKDMILAILQFSVLDYLVQIAIPQLLTSYKRWLRDNLYSPCGILML
jgi:hypothetical protein